MSILDVLTKTFKPGAMKEFNIASLSEVAPPEAHELIKQFRCKILSYGDILTIRRMWNEAGKNNVDAIEINNEYSIHVIGKCLMMDNGTMVFQPDQVSSIPSLFSEVFINELVDQIERINYLFTYGKKAKNDAVGESKKT